MYEAGNDDDDNCISTTNLYDDNDADDVVGFHFFDAATRQQ